MTGRDDYPDEMDELDLDDARAEALLRGEARGDDWRLVRVAAFVRDLRATASTPAAAPSPALAAVLRDGLGPQVPVRRARSRRSAAGWRRWVAVAGIGTSVAMTSVVGAGAAGLLPGPAERVVEDVVETLTPLELPKRVTDGGRTASSAAPRTPTTRSGARVATPTSTTEAPTTTTTPPSTVARPTTSAPPTRRVPAVPSGPGVTTSTVTVAPGPSAGSVPTTSTTVPGLPGLPLPELPDLVPTLPGPLRVPPITVPRLPW